MSKFHLPHTATVLAIALSAALAGCGREQESTAPQTGEGAMSTTERKASEATTSVMQAASSAADTVSAQAKDMAITAEVKTRLARDKELSALAINVDTNEGRVLLRGTAPDTSARNNATELARGVQGVMSVDNELTLQARSN